MDNVVFVFSSKNQYNEALFDQKMIQKPKRKGFTDLLKPLQNRWRVNSLSLQFLKL